MRKIVQVLLFFTAILYAEPDDISSKLVIESESFELDHESSYGVTNNYSLLVAEHQIHANDCLVFYYGTKVGFVIQGHTAENGFGQNSAEYGTIIKANLGVDYDLKHFQKLSFEGSHVQDELHNQIESQIQIGYQYKF